MEAAGDLVARVLPAKLASGVERGHNHLERRNFCLAMHAHRDTAAVVCHAHCALGQQHHFNIIGKAAHRLVA